MAPLKPKRLWSSFRSNLRQTFHRARGKQILHFLHVGKTSGTAIKHALKAHRVTSGHAIVLHGHRFTLREVPQGDQVIFCLRSPISRFVSGFYSRQRQGQPRYWVPWTPDEKVSFEQFETPNRLALALSSSVAKERANAEKAMRTIAHVKDGYAQWFDSEEYLLSRMEDIFFIGFQETVEEDFDAVKSRLGLPANIELPTDEITAHRTPDHLEKRLDPQALENLKAWYAEDFRFFALCRQIRGRTSKEQIPESDFAGAVDEMLLPT
jgi:hypothetical protein